jgi:hypothetical protein
MSKVIADVSMSLDGFVTGPNDSADNPPATHLTLRGYGGKSLKGAHPWSALPS